MNYAVDLLLRASLFGALAAALVLPYRWGGRLLLCQGTVVGIGAYTLAAAVTHLGLHPFLALVLAMLSGALSGVCLALLLNRLNDAASALVSFLVALAGAEAFKNADPVTGGYIGLGNLPTLNLPGFGHNAKATVAITLLLVCALSIVLGGYLRGREFGRAIRALREDYVGAHLDGISAWRVERDAYVLFGLQTGLVGAIWAFGLPRIVPEYFDVMSFGLLIVLGCALAAGDAPSRAVLGAIAVLFLDEATQRLPLAVEIRSDVPLLCVGAGYVVLMLLAPTGVSIQEMRHRLSQWYRAIRAGALG